MNWLDVIHRTCAGNPAPPNRIIKSESEWRRLLTPEQFDATRKKGTEPAHSSDMCALFEPGEYYCVNCDTPLFDSGSKFNGNGGWPCFSTPLTDNVVAFILDDGFGMRRIEVRCNVCDAHLGHVFPDGPEPSGLRFCINAIALNMKPAQTNDL